MIPNLLIAWVAGTFGVLGMALLAGAKMNDLEAENARLRGALEKAHGFMLDVEGWSRSLGVWPTIDGFGPNSFPALDEVSLTLASPQRYAPLIRNEKKKRQFGYALVDELEARPDWPKNDLEAENAALRYALEEQRAENLRIRQEKEAWVDQAF